jgi:drug/metabolite transporter (DMT)-like permease
MNVQVFVLLIGLCVVRSLRVSLSRTSALATRSHYSSNLCLKRSSTEDNGGGKSIIDFTSQPTKKEDNDVEGLLADFVGIGNKADGSNSSLNPLEEEQRAKKSKDEWIARAVLVLVAAVYGTNFSCVKLLGQALDPSLASLLRFTVAGAVFSPYVLDHVKKGNTKLVIGGVEVGIYSALGYYGQAVSLHDTPASTAAFICSLTVLVVPVLDMLFPDVNGGGSAAHGGESGKRSKMSALLPAVLATIGVAFLELGGASSPGTGDLWALAQPLFFGIGFWRTEAFMSSSKPGEPQAFTGAMMGAIAAASLLWTSVDFLGPVAQASGLQGVETALSTQLSAITGDWHILASILWTGIVTTAFTSYGENFAMKTLSSAETTVIFSTEPLWGTAFAAYAFGEAVGANTFLGAFFILVACIWSSVGPSITLPTILSAGQVLSGGLLFEEESSGILSNILNNIQTLIDDLFLQGNLQ